MHLWALDLEGSLWRLHLELWGAKVAFYVYEGYELRPAGLFHHGLVPLTQRYADARTLRRLDIAFIYEPDLALLRPPISALEPRWNLLLPGGHACMQAPMWRVWELIAPFCDPMARRLFEEKARSAKKKLR